VRRFGHERVSTFGIGQELGSAGWHGVYRQLAAKGYLRIDIEGHGGISLTDRCRAVLRGEEPVALRKEVPAAAAKSGSKSPRAKGRKKELLDALGASESSLFEKLRRHRLELSKQLEVPPYTIFHDTTLIELAERRPQTLDQMAMVNGIGLAKLRKYGEGFLAILREHAET
jgi:ATP-dependent DNA helicase RecQ